MSKDLSVGEIQASTKRYVVTCLHDHETLAIGDVVCVAEQDACFWLIRPLDMTLHDIQDSSGQYVHVTEQDCA